MYAQIEKFMASHLGGEYQEDMPEDVQADFRESNYRCFHRFLYEPLETVAAATDLT